MENVTLQHHGVKGMRWGIRRYQNTDGSLTAAGKKRRSLGQAVKDYKTNRVRKKNLEKARAARIDKQKEAAKRKIDLEKGKIPVKKMTDEELKARIARLELEKNCKEIERKTDDYSRGKRFVNKFLDSTVDKVADNAMADVVAQALKVAAVKGINKAIGEEAVFTNNKKKG